jgi:hypothetical protein
MPLNFGVKSFLYGLAASALLAILIAIGVHYTGLLKQVNELSVEKARLEISLGEQRLATQEALNAASDWQEYLDRFSAELDALTIIRNEARDVQRDLQDTLQPGRLQAAAQGRPELVERIVNRGTERSNSLLECASGASASCSE